eukprot:GEMP01095509.1.p1 GENE.GEMP01095509.1~~GEMP01095509.1.p1  ORF type:complete len:119 (+),score=5.40 GEMP01095509.1:345-701(+)
MYSIRKAKVPLQVASSCSFLELGHTNANTAPPARKKKTTKEEERRSLFSLFWRFAGVPSSKTQKAGAGNRKAKAYLKCPFVAASPLYALYWTDSYLYLILSFTLFTTYLRHIIGELLW